MFLTYEITVKSNYTIKEFGVFSTRIILYIKIEAENNKMHRLEQKYWGQFQRMGKMVFIYITGQPLSCFFLVKASTK